MHCQDFIDTYFTSFIMSPCPSRPNYDVDIHLSGQDGSVRDTTAVNFLNVVLTIVCVLLNNSPVQCRWSVFTFITKIKFSPQSQRGTEHRQQTGFNINFTSQIQYIKITSWTEQRSNNRLPGISDGVIIELQFNLHLVQILLSQHARRCDLLKGHFARL